jgi:hypothetical protein
VVTKRTYVRIEERVREAERIAAANGGVLPRQTVLHQTNQALTTAMHRYPERFEHIPTESRVNKSLEEHIKLAERLAAENGNLLPRYKHLREQGHISLTHMMYRHPDAFAHIPSENHKSKQLRQEHYVQLAERLAKEHGGQLNVTREMQKQHNALVVYMRRRPEAFAHIPRVRRENTSREDHVRHMEQLASQNGGQRPMTSVLRKDHPKLFAALRNYPGSFAHIPAERKKTPASDRVTRLEQIAADNGGTLPPAHQIRKIDRNLYSFIYRRPDLISHIPQQVGRVESGKLRTQPEVAKEAATA